MVHLGGRARNGCRLPLLSDVSLFFSSAFPCGLSCLILCFPLWISVGFSLSYSYFFLIGISVWLILSYFSLFFPLRHFCVAYFVLFFLFFPLRHFCVAYFVLFAPLFLFGISVRLSLSYFSLFFLFGISVWLALSYFPLFFSSSAFLSGLFCLIFPYSFPLRHFCVAYFVLFFLFFPLRHFCGGQAGRMWPFC